MSDLPDRELVKVDVNYSLECDSQQAIEMMAERMKVSFSQVSELIVLLVKGIYEEEDGERVIYSLRKIKATKLMSMPSLEEYPASKRCHLTLDAEAYRFLEMLAERYRPVFSGKNEVFSLCVAYVQQICEDTVQVDYLLNRLQSVLEMYPLRPKKWEKG